MNARPDRETAAFFDLDGTIITRNSAALWMKRERRLGRMSRRQQAKGLYYLMLYKLAAIDVVEAMRKALDTMKGLEEEQLREWIFHWFDQEVIIHATDSARDAISEHRRRGDRLVLLSSVSVYEGEAAMKSLGFDHSICTGYEVKDGKITGGLVEPVCYGAGKVTLAEAYAAEANIDLASSYFYSDSYTDLPMLERVGHPRIVDPDPRLRLTSLRRQWPVYRWA